MLTVLVTAVVNVCATTIEPGLGVVAAAEIDGASVVCAWAVLEFIVAVVPEPVCV